VNELKRKLAVALLVTAFGITSVAPAFAVPETPGRGNPDVTASGKCPPGQNKDTSTGGLKKCP
jgi:hypothetical protein